MRKNNTISETFLVSIYAFNICFESFLCHYQDFIESLSRNSSHFFYLVLLVRDNPFWSMQSVSLEQVLYTVWGCWTFPRSKTTQVVLMSPFGEWQPENRTSKYSTADRWLGYAGNTTYTCSSVDAKWQRCPTVCWGSWNENLSHLPFFFGLPATSGYNL